MNLVKRDPGRKFSQVTGFERTNVVLKLVNLVGAFARVPFTGL